MSHLTSEQLADLTELVNARIDEWESTVNVINGNELSRGLVRLLHDVIVEWWEEDKVACPPGDEKSAAAWPKLAAPAVGNPMMDGFHAGYMMGFERGKDGPSDDEVAVEIAEHESTISVAKPLANGSRNGVEKYSSTPVTRNDSAGHRGRIPPTPEETDYEWQQVMDALRAMAVGGNMPTILRWDNEKPSHLRVGYQLLQKFGLSSWIELANLAGLRTGGRGRQGKQDEEEGDEEEEDDLKEDEEEEDDDHADDTKPKRKRPNGKHTPRRRLMGYEQAQTLPSGRRGNVLPTLDDLIARVKWTAMGGVMPTQAAFNDAKPASWATATAHLTRLGISWAELAELAGLKHNRVETANQI